MNNNDFYEVNGCRDFIPVTINETYADSVAVTVDNYMRGYGLVVKEVYRFPKGHEPQKPVIPKFVAEWLESQKESFSDASAIDMYDNLTLDNNGGYYHEVWLWVIAHHHDFIKAWHDGYTVEKEKLYTVEIPDPHGPYEIRYLLRNSAGNICIGVANYKDIFLDAKTHLTESEIKQDFDFLWQFAKEVETDE